jgi:4-hydroxyphenylpyruvate dioxygenase
VVNDAAEAFRISTENGGVPVAAPVTRSDPASGTSLTWAEIKLYGDCVLRFVSGDFQVRSGIPTAVHQQAGRS